jgi:imidazolonepropionase-like amidohydrolase
MRKILSDVAPTLRRRTTLNPGTRMDNRTHAMTCPWTRSLGRAAAAVAMAGTAFLALPAAGLPGTALEAQVPAPRQDRPVALVGATIHPVSGPAIHGGTLVFENGVITAIGANVTIPEGAQRVDLSGKHIYPGLIDAWSSVGLFETGGIDVATDQNEFGDLNPNVRAAVAFHPESRHIGVTRSNGVLVTVSSPSGGLISGMASAMMLDGWTWETMTIRDRAGLIVNWPGPQNPNSYSRGLADLDDAVASARAYLAAKDAADAEGRLFATDARWEAMRPVLDGEVPLMVLANDVRQMQDAITWAEAEGMRLLLLGARDAGYIADYLAEKQVPVLLGSVNSRPGRSWEPVDQLRTLPARLHEAGVRFGISGGSSAPYANRLPYEAGVAMGHGLPELEALRALTLYPAQFLGIDDRVGSLDVGKDATLLITTGNPLEYATTIDQAFIEGRDIDLMDAHRQFYERYSEKLRQLQGRPVL